MWAALSPPWQASLEEAWSAYCAGCIPVGAAVTGAQGKIIARGRNRIYQFEPEGNFLFGHPLAHAEVNALIQLPAGGFDPHVCALYTTSEPCPLCLGAFYMSGVRRLHFASRDPYAGSVNLLGATPYLSLKPIQAYGPDLPGLETILLAIHTESELRSGSNETSRRVIAVLREFLPESVALGESLFKSGELQRMKEQSLPAQQVFDRLANLVIL